MLERELFFDDYSYANFRAISICNISGILNKMKNQSNKDPTMKMYKKVLLLSVFGCFSACAMDTDVVTEKDDKKLLEEGVLFKKYDDLPDLAKENVIKQLLQGMPIKDAIKRICKLRQVSKEFKKTLHREAFLKEVFCSCEFPAEYSPLQEYCVSAYLAHIMAQNIVSKEDARLILKVAHHQALDVFRVV